MYTVSMGQLSSSLFFAQKFPAFFSQVIDQPGKTTRKAPSARVFSITSLLLIVFLSSLSIAPAFAATPLTPKDSYSWSVSVDLYCPLGSDGSFSHVSLWIGKPSFSGCDDALSISLDGSTLTYTITGPSSTLPANKQVATFTVTDLDCGETRSFLVKTDGSGTMLIIDTI